MRVITFSRHFPKGHPRAGQPTHFVEKTWNSFRDDEYRLPDSFSQWTKSFPFKSEDYLKAIKEIPEQGSKHHTIRAGSRWKAGDMASLRVWSDKPYRSKQIEFAQVEVKKVWEIEICEFWWLNNQIMEHQQVKELAKNDGLLYTDFVEWFNIHPKKQGPVFKGQVICWSDKINYTP